MNYREMDRLIAQNIMGWRSSNAHLGNAASWLESINGNPNSHKVICRVGEFRPTERIQDAWRVVEKLRGIYPINIFPNRLSYEVELRTGGGHVQWLEEETVPLAICKASLRTVSYEINGE